MAHCLNAHIRLVINPIPLALLWISHESVGQGGYYSPLQSPNATYNRLYDIVIRWRLKAKAKAKNTKRQEKDY